MGHRDAAFVEAEYYHIYNRGNSKQIIFKDLSDYIRFQQLLYLTNTQKPISVKDAQKRRGGVFACPQEKPLVAVGAYCLMSNHFHIMLSPLVENGVSRYMKKLATGYVMYFNQRHDRSGALFESRFKSRHLHYDQYLKYVFAYIHLNIIFLKHKDVCNRHKYSAALLQEAINYRFSILQDYLLDNREAAMILAKDHFPVYFESNTSLRKELLEWITNVPEDRPRDQLT